MLALEDSELLPECEILEEKMSARAEGGADRESKESEEAKHRRTVPGDLR